MLYFSWKLLIFDFLILSSLVSFVNSFVSSKFKNVLNISSLFFMSLRDEYKYLLLSLLSMLSRYDFKLLSLSVSFPDLFISSFSSESLFLSIYFSAF